MKDTRTESGEMREIIEKKNQFGLSEATKFFWETVAYDRTNEFSPLNSLKIIVIWSKKFSSPVMVLY